MVFLLLCPSCPLLILSLRDFYVPSSVLSFLLLRHTINCSGRGSSPFRYMPIFLLVSVSVSFGSLFVCNIMMIFAPR